MDILLIASQIIEDHEFFDCDDESLVCCALVQLVFDGDVVDETSTIAHDDMNDEVFVAGDKVLDWESSGSPEPSCFEELSDDYDVQKPVETQNNDNIQHSLHQSKTAWSFLPAHIIPPLSFQQFFSTHVTAPFIATFSHLVSQQKHKSSENQNDAVGKDAANSSVFSFSTQLNALGIDEGTEHMSLHRLTCEACNHGSLQDKRTRKKTSWSFHAGHDASHLLRMRRYQLYVELTRLLAMEKVRMSMDTSSRIQKASQPAVLIPSSIIPKSRLSIEHSEEPRASSSHPLISSPSTSQHLTRVSISESFSPNSSASEYTQSLARRLFLKREAIHRVVQETIPPHSFPSTNTLSATLSFGHHFHHEPLKSYSSPSSPSLSLADSVAAAVPLSPLRSHNTPAQTSRSDRASSLKHVGIHPQKNSVSRPHNREKRYCQEDKFVGSSSRQSAREQPQQRQKEIQSPLIQASVCPSSPTPSPPTPKSKSGELRGARSHSHQTTSPASHSRPMDSSDLDPTGRHQAVSNQRARSLPPSNNSRYNGNTYASSRSSNTGYIPSRRSRISSSPVHPFPNRSQRSAYPQV